MSGLPALRAVVVALAVAVWMGAAAATAEAAPPTGVTGMALDGRVEIAWQPVTGATGYKVYRGTTPTTVTTPLMPAPLTPPDLSAPASFTDVTPANGTTYYYAVRAIVSGIESGNSRIIQATPRARSCSTGNAVVQENCFPGTSDWRVGLGDPGVAGFATASGINKGGSVDLKVRSSVPTVDIEVFRSGWYGGTGARLFSTMLNVPVGGQPACVNNPTLGLLDCSNWGVSETLTTTASWPSGVYLLRVVRRDIGRGTHILVVVRDDARRAEVLYGVPDTTYQAYNYWGGKSLYSGKSDPPVTVSGTNRAVKVSFDRPYVQPHDSIMRDWYTRADYPSVFWLERSGYDVSYEPVSGLERNPGRVLDHRAFVSGAHDEYWSQAMRTALEEARNRGVDLFFTGANEVYWKVRFEPSSVSGRQDRTLVNYKSTESGPPDPSGIPTGTWRDPAGANRPENALTGIMYVGQKNFDYFPMRVSAAEGRDRIWRHTGLENQPAGGSTNVGSAIVGWEWDAHVANGQEPAGVTTLASSPVDGDILQDAGRVYAPGNTVVHMTKYTAPSGSLVVSTGTNHWNWGLARNEDSEGEPDRRIQQATMNVLFDMGAFPETPAPDMVLDDPSAPPGITQRTPASGETGVEPGTSVRVGFSRPMDPSSITPSTFTLKRPDNSTVPASVSYDGTSFTATLTPSSALALNTTYTARLDGSIRAANGIALGAPVSWSFTTRAPDTTKPTVSLTAPASGAVVVANATVAATAADNVGVAGVQFKVDGQNVGAEDTSAPYSVDWDARSVSEGSHQLTAVARDTSNNTTTSAAVPVTVDPTGLVAAYGFEEASGATAIDRSGKSNPGTVSGATRSTSGRFGSALSFDGIDDQVTVADSASLDLTGAMTLEGWVNPTNGAGWRTVLMKEQPGGLAYALYGNTDTNRPSTHAYTTSEVDTRGSAALVLSTWTHLAATYDGATLRLYVNGSQVSSRALSGSLIASSGALRIGGNSIWGEWFAGRIDELRVYRRTLSASEIQSDMGSPIVAPDTQAPSAPGGLSATGGLGQAQLSWTAATDNLGVHQYNVHRGTSAGFTPSTANRVAQVTGTSYTDSGMAAGDHFYRVTAEDAAGNVGPTSNEARATVTADTTAPTVNVTAPSNGARVTGTIDVTASASDNVGVAGVQFQLDGADLGDEDTSAPYTRAWSTVSVPNGTHTLTAVARDAAGNRRTSSTVTVTVDNPPIDTSGLVAAYGFEESSGATVADESPAGNPGTITGATRSTNGRFGGALSFDGAGDWVTVADAGSLDLTTGMTLEAWVRPSVIAQWQTVLVKEQSGGLSYGVYGSDNTGRPSAHAHVGGQERDTRATSGLQTGTWTHLAATYDGSDLRLYMNGVQASNRSLSGPLLAGTGPLRIGGNGFASEWFSGLIDEVRVYNRALTATEIQADMTVPVEPPVTDTQAPTAPGSLTATGGLGQVALSWGAASDNVAVAKYNVHRGASAGFTPSTANRIAQVTGTSYTDSGLSAGTKHYRVTAEDAAGNVGPSSPEASATVTADTTPPTVSISAPAGGATVQGVVDVTANASDNVGVAGVQFKLDGSNLGAEDGSAPFSHSWDTTAVANGTHTLSAVARDASGNTTTSAPVTVTVNNPAVPPGLVAAFGFEESSGATAGDSSGRGNVGTISGATRTAAGRFGNGLAFDGLNDLVSVADASSLDLVTGMTLEAWVRPSVLTNWRTVLLKEQANGLVYALYANSDSDRPSGHVFVGNELDTRGAAQLPANAWTHLAVTYDGSALRLYVNGTQASSRPVSGALLSSSGALRIGGNNVWPEWFAGVIDEVRVYQRALSSAEVQADMNRAVAP